MKGNIVQNPQTRTWHRRKSLAALALLTVFAAVTAAAAILTLRPEPEAENLEAFTCRQSNSNQTFAIDVEVNLTDGLDKDETIKIAQEALHKGYTRSMEGELMLSSVDAYANADGTWTVRFEMVFSSSGFFDPGHSGYVTRITRERFEAIISPFDKTVVYSY